MAEEKEETGLMKLKNNFLCDKVVENFKDSLPNAFGEEGNKMATRFAKMAFSAICQSPKLQKCSLASLIRSASESATLGLDLDSRGLAYMVPYYNSKAKTYEANFQVGYQGLMELAYRSGKVTSFNAEVVLESEKDSIIIERNNGKMTVVHPFSYVAPQGEVIAAYAVAEIKGFGEKVCVLRRDQIDEARAKSQAPNSPAWVNHFDWMAKKTVIRQLCKLLPKSCCDELTKAAALDEKNDLVKKHGDANLTASVEAGSEIIESAFAEETETPEGSETTEIQPDFMRD